MAKNAIGGFSQFLSNTTKDAAAKESSLSEEITQISIEKLVPDPNNRYGLRDVELLASMIEANNFHVEALEVRAMEDGNYMIIAGHRRCAAWRILVENNVTQKKTLPCIIRTFEDVHLTYTDQNGQEQDEKFTSDYMANVGLILSNLGQRKDKTLEEQLWEIETLEPYARAIYKAKHEEKEYKGSFRNFFSQEILKISPMALQRKKNLMRLSEKAKKALYEEHLLTETAAVELSRLSEEEQDRYIDDLHEGTISSRVKDVLERKNPEEEEAPDEPDENVGLEIPANQTKHIEYTPVPENEDNDSAEYPKDEPNEPAVPDEIPLGNPLGEVPKNSYQPEEKEDRKILVESIPVPNDILDQDPQKEATSWFKQSMQPMFEKILTDAEAEQRKAEDAGENIVATQWGIRAAVAKYQLTKLLNE